MLLVLFCGLWLRFESLQIAVQPHGLVDSTARVHRHPERPYHRIDVLMRAQFVNARIAFLSACQTAQMSSEEPNESIHIAAAMLFAGFQSVVGTMWSICDSDAPQIAESFYRNLIQDGTIQFSDTAAALHRAVKDLQSSGVSSLRWASFIHIGV